MGKYIINGGNKINGVIDVQGAKNSVLPLFAGAILTKENILIKNCPDLVDVRNMIKILESLGTKVIVRDNEVEILADDIHSSEIPCSLAKELRSSIFLLGSVLSRKKMAKVAYPGGCDIGLRPIDIHIKGLKELNIKIIDKHGYLYCDASKSHSANITLDYPSVGATENIMLASCLLDGVTTISNAACEPEIEDLQNFLNSMGAKIFGGGTSHIIVCGVKKLHGTEYTVMPDRIVAGTYLIACAMCGGNLEINKCNPIHFKSLISKLSKTSCKINVINDRIIVQSLGRLEAFDTVDTQPYPGFPTDLQAQVMALTTIMDGTSIITENIFETRFNHVPELIKMGAKIKVKDRVAIIKGVPKLNGAEVNAMDLRGGASLVLAGLSAEGVTTVNDIHHIERGYQDLQSNLEKLGAKIIRLKDN